MRQFYTIMALFITAATFAQAPQGINYQATIRNAAGELISNQSVTLRFNVIEGSANSNPVYVEQHSAETDDLGAVRLIVGQGTPSSGSFNQIDWSSGNYLGIDVNTGSGFISLGTTQLLSVPYALYAEKSGNAFSIHINTFQFTRQIWDEEGQESTEHALYIKYNMVPDDNENYLETGFVIGLSATVDLQNNLYEYSTGGNPAQGDGISFSDDYSFGQSDGLQANMTYFIRGWAKKSDNSYIYGRAKSITTSF